MSNIKWAFLLGISLIAGMISCKKGDTGPTGPVGPAGPDSVVYSPWINLTPTYDEADTEFEQTLTAPSITQAILDSGIILSYVNFGSSGSSDVVPVSAISSIMIEDYFVDSIQIRISPSYDLTGLPYRYVTIPGSKIAGNKATGSVKGYTIKELKSMSYEHAQSIIGN